ncbi:MAG: AgmX/PglI C-terminal domain-containing protein [Labilithrix sp.]|nr:AgmX/PglI C-terminal domain-containing protein [Labilithrix sp.]MBX3220798.1 AgmX/PglI C-terminal domain-containing protein [Labilithrix sp.]
MSLSPIRSRRSALCLVAGLSLSVAACGGTTPPPKTEEAVKEEPTRETPSGGPTIEQELGSIDQRAVEKKFDALQAKLETCHKQGRDRVDYLAGDVKVFMRVGKDGRVKYSWFEESTLGDRETEKCILDLFGATDWPKPVGGEAEVRNGFGWPGGSERPPTSWGPEKVIGALDDDKDAKKSVEKCKSGVSGDFHVTAYVEPGDAEPGSGGGSGKGNGAGQGKGGHHSGKGHKPGAATATKAGGDHGGRFKAIGVTPPGKEGAEKVDCIVDALKTLSLPSPGSYAAKVTFSL